MRSMRRPVIAGVLAAIAFGVIQSSSAGSQPREYVVLYKSSASAAQGRDAVQEPHAPSRTLATATDTRFQRSRCCSSCFRPEAVRR